MYFHHPDILLAALVLRLGIFDTKHALFRLIKQRRELKEAKEEIGEFFAENAELKSKLMEKDRLIDGMVVRMHNVEQIKKDETLVMAKLRNSIESAERKLRRSTDDGRLICQSVTLDISMGRSVVH